MRARTLLTAGATLLAATWTCGLGAQEGAALLQRVLASPDGEVRMVYPVRDHVYVCRDGSILTGARASDHPNRGWTHRADCVQGVAEVVLEIREGRVVRIRSPAPPGEDVRATDLGRVDAAELAGAMMAVARTGETRVGEAALQAAVLARDVTHWPGLLELARDGDRPERLRRAALFWLGQEAGPVVTRGLVEVAERGEESRKIRDAAVFALSQRPDSEGVPALMELIRESPDPDVRRKALFWLAQSRDPRVLPFFEEILRGG